MLCFYKNNKYFEMWFETRTILTSQRIQGKNNELTISNITSPSNCVNILLKEV